MRCTNAQWAIALSCRLGLPAALGSDARCQLRTRAGEVCGACLDAGLRHPALCGKGPAHLRVHTAVATVLGAELERAGAAVDFERVVPEWYTTRDDGTIEEARLDLVVHFPGAAAMERIDVTIRSPFAVAFERAAGRLTACAAGAAARAGEEAKHRRYGPGVAPFALETFGRLGGEGLALLRRLRRLALDFGRRRPAGGKPLGLNLRRLRARLEAAVLREVADGALLAMGCRASQALGWAAAAHAAAGRATEDAEARSWSTAMHAAAVCAAGEA